MRAPRHAGARPGVTPATGVRDQTHDVWGRAVFRTFGVTGAGRVVAPSVRLERATVTAGAGR